MYRPRQDFLMGSAKMEHLAASKVLINLHRGGSRSLEWVRVLEAMCNGCVVVSERSEDFAPLVPGEDVVFAESTRIVACASAMLRDPLRLGSMRQAALATCRTIDMRASAELLMEMASGLSRGFGRAVSKRSAGSRQALSHPTVPEPLQPASDLPSLAPWAADLPEPFRRIQARLIAAAARAQQKDVSISCVLPAPAATARMVALIADVVGDARQTSRTVAALETQDVAIGAWVGRAGGRDDAAPVGPPGLGIALNTLLRATLAEVVLVIEPGQVLFESSVRRLLGALDVSPDAVAAYGFMANPSAGELWNALPWEPDRLTRRAFLSAPFVIRRSSLVELGGLTEDPALTGYEYHDLWCRIADREWTAAFVQQILGRGERSRPAENGISAIAPEVTEDVLRRSSPRLFADMHPIRISPR